MAGSATPFDGAAVVTAEPVEPVGNELERRVIALERENEQLRATQALLLDAAQLAKVQSLTTLAAGVAHEVNTPLGSLHASADVIQRAVSQLRERMEDNGCAAKIDHKMQRAIRALEGALPITREATERITRLIDGMKELTRLDRDPYAPIDLHQGIDSALEILHHKLDGRIEVERDFGALPLVACQSERVYQLLMNVLCNAVEAIDDGGRIVIATAVDGDWVTVKITDSGRGIPPEHLPRIFDAGYTTRGVGVGTGLGLAIAHRVATDHGGSIAVDSRVGQGTTVTIKLPRAAHRVTFDRG